jgi:hypothetical protein
MIRDDWEKAMRENFQVRWHEISPDEKLLSGAENFALEKYSQAGYNERR